MPDVTLSGLFPLPLVTFERYMLRDETSEHPMTFCLEFDFRGEFARADFDAALDAALGRHPLFGAVVERVRGKGDCWVEATGSRAPLDWGPIDAPLESPTGNVIDLGRELGLRLWLRQGDGRARLTLQIHHACSDAVGAIQFVGDLLAAYAARTGEEPNQTQLAPLDPATLRHRAQFNVEPPEPVSQWQILKATAAEAAKFLGRRPRPLALCTATNGCGTETEPAISFPSVCSHTFGADKTAALAAVARRHDATVNDVLLRDAFRLLAEWNAPRQPRTRSGWLRITMPTNLRHLGNGPLPAANVMSYTFLDRRPRQCDDPDGLLAGIRRETKSIKYWSMGLIHLGGLAFLLRVPGLFRGAVGRRRCVSSLVVSNVGDPTRHFQTRLDDEHGQIRAGNVVLQRVCGAPPVRPLTRAAMLVSRCAGRLTLGLRCDPALFTPGDARSFLDQYVELLDRTASGGSW